MRVGAFLRYAAFAANLFFLASCSEEPLHQETAAHQKIAKETPATGDSFGASLLSCPDNLTNDGCNFISGSGRDHPNQFLMVGLMNNCRTEALPANCSWDGNITQTHNIEVDLNNCCYPFSALNAAMNAWKALAASNRPASNYLIINYERIDGFMVTSYGPYRMVIKVTYRKRGLCSQVSEKKLVAPLDLQP